MQDEVGDMPVSSCRGDEQRLECLMLAMDRLFDRCEDTLRYTDVSIRCWLRSREAHRPYKTPFELVGRPSTTRRYRRSMKGLLCFCIRLWRPPPSTRSSLFRRSFTSAQSEALAHVWSDSAWLTVSRDSLGLGGA